MLEMQISPATIIIAAVILALVVLAVRRLFRKGTCDCKECSHSESTGGCQGCSAVDKMLADMDRAAKNS